MELKEHLQILRRWWWLIVLSTVVAVGSNLYMVWQQPSVYESRTTLIVGQALNSGNATTPNLYISQQYQQTYISLASRTPVRQDTMAALGLIWLPNYVVRAIPDTQLLEISVWDTEPVRAQAVASELANQLRIRSVVGSNDQESSREVFVNEQLQSVEQDIQSTQAEAEKLAAKIGSLTSARAIADTRAELKAFSDKLTTLQQIYSTYLLSTDGASPRVLTVIEEATLPNAPQASNNLWSLASAAAIGMLLAIAAGYSLEYFDDSIRSEEDLRRVTELPVLASVSRIKHDENGDYPLVALTQPRSLSAESYRLLRTGISFGLSNSASRTILINSANPSEGKSLTTGNLALVTAQAGHRVLLIDCDLRKPKQHHIFGLSNSFGLTNYFLDFEFNSEEGVLSGNFNDLIKKSEQEGLDILTSGPLPPNPAELLGSPKMAILISAFNTLYDFIIIDSSPCLAVTDPIVLSSFTDGVLLVINKGSTHRSHVKQMIERLQRADATILGICMNGKSTTETGYGYGSSGRYGYYATDDEETISAPIRLRISDKNGSGKQNGTGRKKSKKLAKSTS